MRSSSTCWPASEVELEGELFWRSPGGGRKGLVLEKPAYQMVRWVIGTLLPSGQQLSREERSGYLS